MSNSNHDPETGVSLVDGPVHDPDSGLLDKQRERPGHVRQGLSHTLAEKNLMAITGLFLCVSLVVHLLGNLQLLLPTQVAQWQFNFYSKLLSENIFIHVISYILFGSIAAHAIYALVITIKNRQSNGRRYEYDRRGVSSKWYSRKMGLLGTVILFFLIIHLRDFWYQVQFGHLPLDKDGQEDLYTLVVTVYRNGWYVLIYVLCMVALGYHLLHGFFSCITGIEANRERCLAYVQNSIGLVTALNPVLGYEKSAAIAKEALVTNRSVYELVLEKKLLTQAQLDDILKPENMTHPRKLAPHA
jgi:succinate dehydrogenase / fumarate reductase cytochrome b subunit